VFVVVDRLVPENSFASYRAALFIVRWIFAYALAERAPNLAMDNAQLAVSLQEDAVPREAAASINFYGHDRES
jgi:hypothetical protein